MLHTNKRRSQPDRRGGKMNQAKPKLSEKHEHIMVPWASDRRFTRCDYASCPYAEINGKPVRGPKERTHAYEQSEMFVFDEMNAVEEGGVA